MEQKKSVKGDVDFRFKRGKPQQKSTNATICGQRSKEPRLQRPWLQHTDERIKKQSAKDWFTVS